jgi:hypothetical protein
LQEEEKSPPFVMVDELNQVRWYLSNSNQQHPDAFYTTFETANRTFYILFNLFGLFRFMSLWWLMQGLDPDRERYIMQVMLDNAEGDESPQSFVVTPKLLMNLPVRRNVSTHIIMNGHVACPILAPQSWATLERWKL